jgi:predicted TIM-barrel enzyme
LRVFAKRADEGFGAARKRSCLLVRRGRMRLTASGSICARVDLMVIYGFGRYRMAGRGSLATPLV